MMFMVACCLVDSRNIHSMISMDVVWWWRIKGRWVVSFFYSYTTLIVIFIWISSMGIIGMVVDLILILGRELELVSWGLPCFFLLLSLLLCNLDTSHGVPILCATSFRSTHCIFVYLLCWAVAEWMNQCAIVSSSVCVCVCVCVCEEEEQEEPTTMGGEGSEVCWLTDYVTPPPRVCLLSWTYNLSITTRMPLAWPTSFLTFASVLSTIPIVWWDECCDCWKSREEKKWRRTANSKQHDAKYEFADHKLPVVRTKSRYSCSDLGISQFLHIFLDNIQAINALVAPQELVSSTSRNLNGSFSRFSHHTHHPPTKQAFS